MNRLFTVLAVIALSVLPATAQKKLWTWRIKDTSGFRLLTAISLNQDGSGAFVLGEATLRGKPVTSYLLVWVDSRGKVLLSRRFTSRTGSPPWELAFTGPGKLVASYDKKAFLFKAVEGRASFVKSVPVKNIMVFGSSTFGGWVDCDGESYLVEGGGEGEVGYPGYVPYTPDQVIQDVSSLTAWKF